MDLSQIFRHFSFIWNWDLTRKWFATLMFMWRKLLALNFLLIHVVLVWFLNLISWNYDFRIDFSVVLCLWVESLTLKRFVHSFNLFFLFFLFFWRTLIFCKLLIMKYLMWLLVNFICILLIIMFIIQLFFCETLISIILLFILTFSFCKFIKLLSIRISS